MLRHFIAALSLLLLAEGQPPPAGYPLFKQCDPAWGDDIMVTKTICSVGCLMSSVSDGLAGWNISIPDGDAAVDANPGTLNTWLQKNDGYDDSNDLIEEVRDSTCTGP